MSKMNFLSYMSSIRTEGEIQSGCNWSGSGALSGTAYGAYGIFAGSKETVSVFDYWCDQL